MYGVGPSERGFGWKVLVNSSDCWDDDSRNRIKRQVDGMIIPTSALRSGLTQNAFAHASTWLLSYCTG